MKTVEDNIQMREQKFDAESHLVNNENKLKIRNREIEKKRTLEWANYIRYEAKVKDAKEKPKMNKYTSKDIIEMGIKLQHSAEEFAPGTTILTLKDSSLLDLENDFHQTLESIDIAHRKNRNEKMKSGSSIFVDSNNDYDDDLEFTERLDRYTDNKGREETFLLKDVVEGKNNNEDDEQDFLSYKRSSCLSIRDNVDASSRQADFLTHEEDRKQQKSMLIKNMDKYVNDSRNVTELCSFDKKAKFRKKSRKRKCDNNNKSNILTYQYGSSEDEGKDEIWLVNQLEQTATKMYKNHHCNRRKQEMSRKNDETFDNEANLKGNDNYTVDFTEKVDKENIHCNSGIDLLTTIHLNDIQNGDNEFFSPTLKIGNENQISENTDHILKDTSIKIENRKVGVNPRAVRQMGKFRRFGVKPVLLTTKKIKPNLNGMNFSNNDHTSIIVKRKKENTNNNSVTLINTAVEAKRLKRLKLLNNVYLMMEGNNNWNPLENEEEPYNLIEIKSPNRNESNLIENYIEPKQQQEDNDKEEEGVTFEQNVTREFTILLRANKSSPIQKTYQEKNQFSNNQRNENIILSKNNDRNENIYVKKLSSSILEKESDIGIQNKNIAHSHIEKDVDADKIPYSKCKSNVNNQYSSGYSSFAQTTHASHSLSPENETNKSATNTLQTQFGYTSNTVAIGRGLGNILNILCHTGEISGRHAGKEILRGRAKDERTYEDYESLDLRKVVKIKTNCLCGETNETSIREKNSDLSNREIKLEYRDNHGRLVTRKEAYRNLCYQFHGYGSSKKNQERKLRHIEQERNEHYHASWQGSNSEDEIDITGRKKKKGTLCALKATQKFTGKAFVVHKTM